MIVRLQIGALIVPTEALLEFDQDYRELEARAIDRAASGSVIIRTLWDGKLATRINATGWTPGLEDLDAGQVHTIRGAIPRAASSATTTVTLPSNRRTDVDPIGLALVPEGTIDREVETPITNLAAINAKSTDDATLTAVSGAVGYRVKWFPEFSAVITTLRSRGDHSASYRWELEAEEV